MATFKMLHGDESNISLDITPFHEGWAYITTSGYYYVDLNIGTVESPNNQRIKLNSHNAETLMGMTLDEIKAYVQVQADWNQTDATKADFILNKPVEATDDEVMALLISRNVIMPVSDSTGYVYLDKDQKILTM